MIERRGLLRALFVAPAIIPSGHLMPLSWRSSQLLLAPAPLPRIRLNWTIAVDMLAIQGTDVERELTEFLKAEKENEYNTSRNLGHSASHRSIVARWLG